MVSVASVIVKSVFKPVTVTILVSADEDNKDDDI